MNSDGAVFSMDGFEDTHFTHLTLGNHSNASQAIFPPQTSSGIPPGLGRMFYAWFTPVILLIGIVGNSLSLSVFTSRNMRSLSASNYLAALSISDLVTLVAYVMVEWLKRGLHILPGHLTVSFLEINGVCHVSLYLSYVSRFLSSWIVVIFTVERYIAVCHPLRRKSISTSVSRRIVFGLVAVAAIILMYKPIMSGSYIVAKDVHVCTSNPYLKHVSHILDIIYGVTITLVPFILITALNMFIINKLVRRNRKYRDRSVLTEESVIRLEFTLILLVISLCFIAFNLPYFVVWARTAFSGKPVSPGVVAIVRAMYYLNYCVNFFLYSITGACFRRELRMLFRYKMKKGNVYVNCMKIESHTQQSWV